MNWHDEIRSEFIRRQKAVDDTVVEELAQHATAAFEEARADGQSPDDAERHVRALLSSWCETDGPRRIERAPLIESAPAGSSIFAGLSLDLRQAVRLLRRQPGVACVSILMIALGIGVTSTLFSLVNGVLLKPLPWKTADRLVRVYEERSGMSARDGTAHMLTNVTYNAWSDRPQIDGVAGWTDGELMLAGDAGLGAPAYAAVTDAVPAGEPLLLGANFTAEDARANSTVILSTASGRSASAAPGPGKADHARRPFADDSRVMPRGFEVPRARGCGRRWVPPREPGSNGRRVFSSTGSRA